MLILPITIASLMVISSCKGKKESIGPICVKLTKEQIQKWADSGYGDSTNRNYMAGVRFRPAYGGQGGSYKIFVQGYRKDGTVITESLTELKPIDTCNKTHIIFTEFITVGVIPFTSKELNIFTREGKVTGDLKYLEFVPSDYYHKGSGFHFLRLEPYTVKEDGSQIQLRPSTEPPSGLPCPPCQYCKEPCPPPTDCKAPCNIEIYDSVTSKEVITDMDKPTDTVKNE
jgi:hypothetical protein